MSLKNHIRDCFTVHSYCQCIITIVVVGLTGGEGGATSPNVSDIIGNSAIFYYYSVNSATFSYHFVTFAIVLNPASVFRFEVQCAGWKDQK